MTRFVWAWASKLSWSFKAELYLPHKATVTRTRLEPIIFLCQENAAHVMPRTRVLIKINEKRNFGYTPLFRSTHKNYTIANNSLHNSSMSIKEFLHCRNYFSQVRYNVHNFFLSNFLQTTYSLIAWPLS